MASKRQRRELRRLSESVVRMPACVPGKESDYEFEDEVEIPLPKFSSAAVFAEAERQSESPFAIAVEELKIPGGQNGYSE